MRGRVGRWHFEIVIVIGHGYYCCFTVLHGNPQLANIPAEDYLVELMMICEIFETWYKLSCSDQIYLFLSSPSLTSSSSLAKFELLIITTSYTNSTLPAK